MTKEDIIRMAREAGFDALLPSEEILGRGRIYTGSDDEISDELERFAALVAAAERNKVAQWMIDRGYATGHGDTVDDLLNEFEWQVKEQEREACAKVCDLAIEANSYQGNHWTISGCAKAIRARREE
jgi:hypothetical protein